MMNGMRAVIGMMPGGEGGGGTGFSFLTMMLIIFAIMYFLIIRPQRKKDQDRRRMLEDVKKNDKIVTIGGIHGHVMSVRGDEVTVRIDHSKDVRVKFNKTAVSRILTSAEGDVEGGSETLEDAQ